VMFGTICRSPKVTKHEEARCHTHVRQRVGMTPLPSSRSGETGLVDRLLTQAVQGDEPTSRPCQAIAPTTRQILSPAPQSPLGPLPVRPLSSAIFTTSSGEASIPVPWRGVNITGWGASSGLIGAPHVGR
jgi:hypothetical protein